VFDNLINRTLSFEACVDFDFSMSENEERTDDGRLGGVIFSFSMDDSVDLVLSSSS